MAVIADSVIMKAAQCMNCDDLFSVMFVKTADGDDRCNVCKKKLSEQESKEDHIQNHHATCCFNCKTSLLVKNNKGKVGAVAGIIAAPALLPVVGFTATGVTAGSIAAGVQSAVYGAYTTGIFSLLQSAGTGAAYATGTVMAGGGAIGGLMGKAIDTATRDNNTSSDESTDTQGSNEKGKTDEDEIKTNAYKNPQ